VDRHRIFIIGDSLFADGVIAALRRVDTVRVIGTASSLEAAASQLSLSHLDVIILVDTTEEDSLTDFGGLVARFPKLPIIRTTLIGNKIQVTTSQCVSASMSELLDAIATLPKGS